METNASWLPEPVHITVDGASVATYVLGPEERTPLRDVVFCHGTPWSSQVWAAAAHHLSRSCRVFLWDMPGYGRSTKDQAVPVDLASQMSRFAQLLAYWRLDRPHVVAHDIGGAVALGAHLLHDSAYADLFLWDAVTLDPWGSPFFRLVADHVDVFTELPAALHMALVREYVAGAAHRPLTPQWVDALSRPWSGAPGQAAFYRQMAALRPEHTRPVVARLPEVRCPVTIGWGARDPWIPAGQAARLKDSLPGNPTVTELADVGHLAPVEAPSQVTRALEEWLASSGTYAP
ncbi:alpha/beta fold hydrolase [Streptomyces indicus]|uniref:Pimeloyl-ACP methyl ester carboxylesterase n=1 Tax=Streptomyces indicus TaxID=417292 RepID=A0A1G9AAN8_9ACTN|nr:alpha/beta hydrolase [Streptomyces indicus]SDK23894.1 Pimeloyl-ACP methyl ester carboxylesterase [Streptomyces indicus]